MRREDLVGLAERVLSLAERRTTDMATAPCERDISTYRDPARFKLEKKAIFRSLPIWAGFSSDLRSPGDFLTHDATGLAIVIVRQEDGTLAAFLNACRHRGARIVTSEAG